MAGGGRGRGSDRRARPHMTGQCCDLKEGRKEEGRPHTALAAILGNLSEVGLGCEWGQRHQLVSDWKPIVVTLPARLLRFLP